MWRSLGLARTGTSSPILYEPSSIATDTHTLHQCGFQLGANLRGKKGNDLQVSVRLFSFFPFYLHSLSGWPADLSALLQRCCNRVVGTASAGSLGVAFVMAASRAVSPGPVSTSFPGHNDIHRLCSPSGSSRCKSDGFLGRCGLDWIFFYYTCLHTIHAASPSALLACSVIHRMPIAVPLGAAMDTRGSSRFLLVVH